MPSYKDVIVDALEKKYEAQMAQAEANVKVFIENPVGVGEHPNIVQEVEKLLKEIKDAKEMLDELKNWR
tara:strand:+ start:625 stop:831 length:207 start_codon:yes stop_codon:yes gene_type:complete